MVKVEWGAEIYGGCPSSVDEDTPVMNKDRIEVPASCWMQEFEPYKLHANHAYYGNRAEPANDELAELRAFKEAAIARFPELAPVDPHFAEAKNLMQGSEWSSGTECKTPHDPDFEGSVCDVVLKAIKRGRELERYAQGLTTPKD